MLSISASISALRRCCVFMFFKILKNAEIVNRLSEVFAEISRCTLSWKYDRYNIAGISLVEYTEHGVKVTIQSVTKDDGLKDATDGYSKLMEKFCNILLKQLQALPAVPPEALRKPEDGAKVDEAETGKQVLKEEQEPKADGKPANAAPISDK